MYIINPCLEELLASAVPAFPGDHTHLEIGRNNINILCKSAGELVPPPLYHLPEHTTYGAAYILNIFLRMPTNDHT